MSFPLLVIHFSLGNAIFTLSLLYSIFYYTKLYYISTFFGSMRVVLLPVKGAALGACTRLRYAGEMSAFQGVSI